MIQEEKFKEAKRLYQTANADQKYVLESLFPELKENKDEKIRKYLKHIIGEWSYDDLFAQGFRKEDIIAWLEKHGQKLAAWSEEDEEQLGRALYMMEQLDMTKSWDDVYNWLKSLKDRVLPQSQWSEEDESRITTICTYLQDYARLSGSESRTIRINEYCDWLKSLRP